MSTYPNYIREQIEVFSKVLNTENIKLLPKAMEESRSIDSFVSNELSLYLRPIFLVNSDYKKYQDLLINMSGNLNFTNWEYIQKLSYTEDDGSVYPFIPDIINKRGENSYHDLISLRREIINRLSDQNNYDDIVNEIKSALQNLQFLSHDQRVSASRIFANQSTLYKRTFVVFLDSLDLAYKIVKLNVTIHQLISARENS